MPDMIEAVHPTRSELLAMKKRTKLAEKGHKLLKEKRDVLVVEFFNIVKDAKTITGELTESIKTSYEKLIRTEAVMGPSEVESIASGVEEIGEVRIEEKNIMGVHVPKLEVEIPKAKMTYGPALTSPVLDETMDNFGESLRKIIEYVEVGESARRLSEEIKKTKRRVNALEYIVLPRLDNTQKYIQMRLDELERENFFRLKTIKRKRMRDVN